MLHRLIFGKKDLNISRRTYYWNLCSSLLYSIQSAVLMLLVTRFVGIDSGGVFSTIYAVTQTLTTLGSYGMRNFQVSDAKNKYSFDDYLTSRYVTCFLMLLSCFGCSIYYYGFNLERDIVFVCFTLFRFLDGIEDVYHGHVQKKGRLDAVSVVVTLRIILSTFFFGTVAYVTKNLLFASVAFAIVNLVCYYILNRIIKNEFFNNIHIKTDRVVGLLAECFPVFSGGILYNYLVNAPKLSIAKNLSESTQAEFNIIFMPIFVINVLSMFIFKPVVARMGVWWVNKDLKKLAREIFKQTAIILGLTIIISICGYLFGWWLLGIVYGVELGEFKLFLAKLLLFGGIAALDSYGGVILTIIRKQKYIVVGYVIAFFLNYLIMDRFVSSAGMVGAGYAYGIVMAFIAILFTIVIILTFVSNNKSKNQVRKEIKVS